MRTAVLDHIKFDHGELGSKRTDGRLRSSAIRAVSFTEHDDLTCLDVRDGRLLARVSVEQLGCQPCAPRTAVELQSRHASKNAEDNVEEC